MTLNTLLVLVLPASAATVSVDPGEDWCAELNSASPGDTVELSAGDHAGPCVVSASGAEGSPIVLRAADGAEVSITYDGTSAPEVIAVEGSDLLFERLVFGPTEAGVGGLRVRGDRVSVVGCGFVELGAPAINSDGADIESLVVASNNFKDMGDTAIRLGCFDGSCAATDFRIESNLIDGVDSDFEGFGVDIRLNSAGVLRDNVIHDTKAGGIQAMGSYDASASTLIDGNLVLGSEEAAGIMLGGGPATISNNIVEGGPSGGIWSYDADGRGLLRQTAIRGNTVVGVEGQAILLEDWAGLPEMVLAGNAAWQSSGSSDALPGAISGVDMTNNVECDASCWDDPENRDFWPASGGALIEAGAPGLVEDYCRSTRGTTPTAGAIEGLGEPMAPLEVDFKGPCLEEDPGGDTGDPGGEDSGDPGGEDSGDPGGEDSGDPGNEDSGDPGGDSAGDDTGVGGGGDDKGCGCASGSPGAAGGLWLGALLLGLGWRRRG